MRSRAAVSDMNGGSNLYHAFEQYCGCEPLREILGNPVLLGQGASNRILPIYPQGSYRCEWLTIIHGARCSTK